MDRFSNRSHLLVFYLAAGLMFAAVLLRSLLLLADSPRREPVLGLLAAWLVLFLLETLFTSMGWVWRASFPIYLAAQCAVVVTLLLQPGETDFYAILLAVLGFQVVQRLDPRVAVTCLVLFVPLTAVPLALNRGAAAAGFVLIYTGVNVMLAFYGFVTRRAEEGRLRNEALMRDLSEANHRLRDYSGRLERLAVARERQRMARELHDSVTQTAFSMNLTSQAAVLLMERDPGRVPAQLERLGQLTMAALAEMQVLLSQLRPHQLSAGLADALQRHLADPALPADFELTLELEDAEEAAGGEELTAAEEDGLFRIAQEALNNVAKHAGAAHATVRLRLSPPMRLEIWDDGCGFDPAAHNGEGLGLSSMSERALEIGCRLRVVSGAGDGTRVIVERDVPDGTLQRKAE